MATEQAPRRGWREPIESGIHRAHRVACPSTDDHKARRRCSCPYEVRVPGGRGSSRTVTVDGSLEDARRHRARAQADAGTVREAPSAPETLREHAAAWFRVRATQLAPSTLQTYDIAYRKRIDPHLGEVPLEQVTRKKVEEWVALLIAKEEPRRQLEIALRTLSTMLTAAVEWHALPMNPAMRIKLPPAPPKVRAVERVLTDAQAQRLVLHAGGLRNETMIRAALEAGLRRGEIVGLRWPDVQFDERRLVVRRSVWRGSKGPQHVRVPKAGRERRCAITRDFAKRLGEWYEASVVSGGASADGYVWPGNEGEPLDGRAAARVVERACKRAKLIDVDEKALVSTHRLRHTAVSSALARGVALMTVSKQIGHADPRVTAEVYAHLVDDAQLDDFTPPEKRGGGGAGGGVPRKQKKRRN